jgi:hypothetical protein
MRSRVDWKDRACRRLDGSGGDPCGGAGGGRHPRGIRQHPLDSAGNVVSLGYQSDSVSEFGDLIQLGPGERSSAKLPVTVIMSIWACETGGMATCETTPGATWDQG